MKPAAVCRWIHEDNPKFTDKELKEIYAWCIEERDKTRFQSPYIDDFIADYEKKNTERYKKKSYYVKKGYPCHGGIITRHYATIQKDGKVYRKSFRNKADAEAWLEQKRKELKQ